MALANNITSLLCSILAWIFFVIGCIGNSTSSDNVENAPWIIVNPSQGGNHIFFGTQALYQKDSNFLPDDIIKYKNCNLDFCVPCKDNGRVTFALLVIAVCFAGLAIVFSAVLCGAEAVNLQYTNLSVTAASTIMAVVGWSVFMRRCYHSIDEVTNNLSYGVGSSITVLGFLLMGISVIVQVHSIWFPSVASNQAARVPAQEQQEVEVVSVEEAKPVETA